MLEGAGAPQQALLEGTSRQGAFAQLRVALISEADVQSCALSSRKPTPLLSPKKFCLFFKG